MKFIAILLIIAILVSLFSALFSIIRAKESKKAAKALTIRIGLSLLLFMLLVGSFYAGLWVPHQI